MTEQTAATGTERESLIDALEWYAVQVRDCRKITPEGDKARHALDADGGHRARHAISRAEGRTEPKAGE